MDCNDTGFLPAEWATGNNFIKEAAPFQTSGGCCIPCSGFLAADGTTNPRNYGIQYISVDDGVGGFIETCTGYSGAKNPGYLPWTRGTCCTANLHGINPYYDCKSWLNGGNKVTTCFGGGAGCYTTTAGGPSFNCTFYGLPTHPGRTNPFNCYCDTISTHVTTKSCCMTTFKDLCCNAATYWCYCQYSGFIPTCHDFVWEPATPTNIDDPHCRFTGTLYDNDGLTSKDEGAAQLFFDVCRNQWALQTTYTGINGQWPTGQFLYGQCTACSGLDQCREEAGYWYGYFQPDSGPGEAFVCVSQGSCDFPSLNKSMCKTVHAVNLYTCD